MSMRTQTVTPQSQAQSSFKPLLNHAIQTMASTSRKTAGNALTPKRSGLHPQGLSLLKKVPRDDQISIRLFRSIDTEVDRFLTRAGPIDCLPIAWAILDIETGVAGSWLSAYRRLRVVLNR